MKIKFAEAHKTLSRLLISFLKDANAESRETASLLIERIPNVIELNIQSAKFLKEKTKHQRVCSEDEQIYLLISAYLLLQSYQALFVNGSVLSAPIPGAFQGQENQPKLSDIHALAMALCCALKLTTDFYSNRICQFLSEQDIPGLRLRFDINHAEILFLKTIDFKIPTSQQVWDFYQHTFLNEEERIAANASSIISLPKTLPTLLAPPARPAISFFGIKSVGSSSGFFYTRTSIDLFRLAQNPLLPAPSSPSHAAAANSSLSHIPTVGSASTEASIASFVLPKRSPLASFQAAASHESTESDASTAKHAYPGAPRFPAAQYSFFASDKEAELAAPLPSEFLQLCICKKQDKFEQWQIECDKLPTEPLKNLSWS